MSKVEEFFAEPSEELLSSYTKEQLVEVAQHYKITVDSQFKRSKPLLLSCVTELLIESGVLTRRPESPLKSVSEQDVRLREMAVQEKRLDTELALRKLEVEREEQQRQFELRKLELELAAKGLPVPPSSPFEPPQSPHTNKPLEVSKYIRMVPPFSEKEVDKYFPHFERVATSLRWPKEIWTLLLQCVLVGRAQDIYASLSAEQSSCYDTVKSAILRAYELVPEAYRQRFREYRKFDKHSFVEFAREKERLFDRWCTSQKVCSFDLLRQLVLLEEFKNCVPDVLKTYLNEQKPSTLAEAAVLADEFALTHRGMASIRRSNSFSRNGGSYQGKSRPAVAGPNTGSPPRNPSNRSSDKVDVVCFYCRKPGHKITECHAYKKVKVKGVTLAAHSQSQSLGGCVTESNSCSDVVTSSETSDYAPFITLGFVSLPGHGKVPVRVLRDTGAAQSFLLEGVLPLSAATATGKHVLIRGIEMGYLEVPLHRVQFSSKLVNGSVVVGVRSCLPVPDIEFVLGNDLAGANVWESPCIVPPPVVMSPPLEPEMPDLCGKMFPHVFPVCAITRAKAKQLQEFDALECPTLSPELTWPPGERTVSPAHADSSFDSGACNGSPVLGAGSDKTVVSDTKSSLHVDGPLESEPAPEDSVSRLFQTSREGLIAEQESDNELKKLFSVVVPDLNGEGGTCYVLKEGVLCRKWTVARDDFSNTVVQVVVPLKFRQAVLELSHGGVAGHTGVRKTYDRVARRFFWPGLKRDISKYIRECHTCQMTGKPNQKIPDAPLQPIPAVSTPFEHLLVDCVGPLPRSRAGHSYLLTIMCQSTRYPSAYPLRSITTRSVLRALTAFMSTFGIPQVIQSDQGSNFMSRQFARALRQLKARHNISSAYHPQSQGALERFHQTLKSLLRSFCVELSAEWEEGLPWLLLAIREVAQESLGFSPNELVFGHAVRGPTAVLAEEWSAKQPPANVLDYVSGFRYRLYQARAASQKALARSQCKMQRLFNRKAVARCFEKGDQVLALLPVISSPFQARFAGPYTIVKCLSDRNYLLLTPDRKKRVQVCHANLLKRYFPAVPVGLVTPPVCPPSYGSYVVATSPVEKGSSVCSDTEDVTVPSREVTEGRLHNSQMLAELRKHLPHLSVCERADIVSLVNAFPSLFPDVPSRTTIVEHDIIVGSALPIKQPAYRVNPAKRAILRKEVEYLLAHDLAEPSLSSWSSPCLLVGKPDGTYRFCTDYRKLNAVTSPDCYPLPRVDDCVDRIGAARFVSKFDLLKGYWQVPLTPRARELSAFVTPDNFLQYKVMPFGLRNAPATFQRLINYVLSGMTGCEAYLDDVVVFSATWGQHLEQIKELFERLSRASLTVNLAKCEFAKATVTYLGRVVGRGQVRPVSAKVEAICNFPVPSSRRELRRFLGMVGYYRGFCQNFATVVTPLTNLLSTKVHFQWNESSQQAFDSAKALLSSAPVLAAPSFDDPFLLAVDASDCGAGAVLLQVGSDGVEHPVCYFSKKFNRHQLAYSTVEKEALALVLAVQFFEVYLSSAPCPITVYTDHNPLVFIDRMRNSNQRIMRWSLILQPYPLKIKYIKGVDNVLADALSRV
ncbi:hypothetical protein ACEWY4_000059 [Coilia grayii]|uniref:Gypsy retrotransposon integrase-like protein 1 n=1 Tax=Coilia grayii TaxID=363190 RepID=A0ABD1KW12_9TELE